MRRLRPTVTAKSAAGHLPVLPARHRSDAARRRRRSPPAALMMPPSTSSSTASAFASSSRVWRSADSMAWLTSLIDDAMPLPAPVISARAAAAECRAERVSLRRRKSSMRCSRSSAVLVSFCSSDCSAPCRSRRSSAACSSVTLRVRDARAASSSPRPTAACASASSVAASWARRASWTSTRLRLVATSATPAAHLLQVAQLGAVRLVEPVGELLDVLAAVAARTEDLRDPATDSHGASLRRAPGSRRPPSVG